MLTEAPERLYCGSPNPAEVADQAPNSTLAFDNEGATVAYAMRTFAQSRQCAKTGPFPSSPRPHPCQAWHLPKLLNKG
jgi:hypothetical protein